MRLSRGPLLKVLAFVATMSLLIAAIGIVFGRVRLQPAHEFHAEFKDASGLVSGADVRGNGVAIGSVKDVELSEDGVARVTFTVDEKVVLDDATAARIRYANLTGDRYLDLTPGGGKRAGTLEPGETIPVSRTRQALDLDDFFRGFDPLLRGLDPAEMNELSRNILAVTDGQAGAVERMLANVGRFTGRLAEREQIIGRTITDVSQALALMDGHRGEIDELIVGMDNLLKGFAKDRKLIGNSLASVDAAAFELADVLRRVRPGVKKNIDQIGVLAREVNDKAGEWREVLDLYPKVLTKFARLGSYGSFFNFYLCGVRVKVNLPGETLDVYTPWVIDKTGRCESTKR